MTEGKVPGVTSKVNLGLTTEVSEEIQLTIQN